MFCLNEFVKGLVKGWAWNLITSKHRICEWHFNDTSLCTEWPLCFCEISTYTLMCIYIYIYIHVYICICICICICIYIYTHMTIMLYTEIRIACCRRWRARRSTGWTSGCLWYTVLCYATLYYTTPYYAITYYNILYYAKLYHITPYHSMLY